MEEEKLLKHVCKFCKKRFACGRSLGGHIRRHLPKPGNHGDMLNKSFETETGSLRLNKVNNQGHCKRSSHVGDNSHSSTFEVIEVEQQDEDDVAMCLIMLSRDVRPWGSAKNPQGNNNDNKKRKRGKILQGNESVFTAVNGEKLMSLACEHLQKGVKLKGVEIEEVKMEEFQELEYEFSDKSYCKRSKFECTTCNKVFHSYQALGGHKASHKKLLGGKSCPISSNSNEKQPSQVINHVFTDISLGPSSTFSKKVGQKHECPFCYRLFPSGQSLGGHKRSHLLGSNNSEGKISQSISSDNVVERSSLSSEYRDALDLNLPPYHVQEEGNATIPTASSSNSLVGLIKPYWWIEDPYNHESFLSLIPN